MRVENDEFDSECEKEKRKKVYLESHRLKVL